MRIHQLIDRNNYAELVCVLPNSGMTTLYRSKSFADAKSYQVYFNLRTYQGKKVSVIEHTSEGKEPTGWLYKENQQQGVKHDA